MKINTITYKILRSLGVCLALVLFTRCDFIFDEGNKEDYADLETQLVETEKYEAKLLVSASQHNLDIVELIGFIKQDNTNEEVFKIAETIEDHQKLVFEQYQNIAKQHVISIPNHAQIDKRNYFDGNEVAVEKVLVRIKSKLDNQRDALNNLATKTNDEDFRILAEKAREQLVMSIDETAILKKQILNY